MIDFRSEILKKRIKKNKKVGLYNSVINEYLEQIKDVFEYGDLRVECYEKEDGLLKIDVHSNNDRTIYYFSYNDVERCMQHINSSDDLAGKNMIENELKNFVLAIAEKEDIKIEEKNKMRN